MSDSQPSLRFGRKTAHSQFKHRPHFDFQSSHLTIPQLGVPCHRDSDLEQACHKILCLYSTFHPTTWIARKGNLLNVRKSLLDNSTLPITLDTEEPLSALPRLHFRSHSCTYRFCFYKYFLAPSKLLRLQQRRRLIYLYGDVAIIWKVGQLRRVVSAQQQGRCYDWHRRHGHRCPGGHGWNCHLEQRIDQARS